MKERNYNYDLLRIFACIMIIAMHAPAPTSNPNGIFLSSVSYFTAPGLLPTAIAIAAPVACKVAHIEVDFYSRFWYLSFFVTILTVAMYKVFTIKKLTLTKGGKLERLIITTSGLSFGIYLIHIAIMRNWLWKQEWITSISNYYLQWAIIVTITFICSWLITYIISLLPFGAYIIGYKSKRK